MLLKNDTLTMMTILSLHSIGGIFAITIEMICNRTIDKYSAFVYMVLGWAAFLLVCITDTFYDKVEEFIQRLRVEVSDFIYYTNREMHQTLCYIITRHKDTVELANGYLCKHCGHMTFKKARIKE